MSRNLTFDDLGFDNFEVVIRPVQPEGAAAYSTLNIKKPIENLRDFMYRNLAYHMNNVSIGSFVGQFFGGAAYMRDGSVVIVYNGVADDQSDKLYAMVLAPDQYKKVNAEGVELKNNIEYVRGIFNARKPRALLLLQEIEGTDENNYHFRIVHERKEDSKQA